MEPNESELSSFYQHPRQQQPQPQPQPPTLQQTAALTSPPPQPAAPSNGVQSAFPHSSSGEPVKRKRGRPRKYGTAEQGTPKKKTPLSPSSSSPKKKERFFGVGASGNAGPSFIPHIIDVLAGEDVGQKIMLFMQQSKREMCILSASGAISNASLRQPASSGGNITIEGRFEILSLSGSYVRTEIGGRTGGLSVCLSSTDGQILGGGVGGPLTAAGPVQVIVGTFALDARKDLGGSVKGDASASKLPSPVGGGSASTAGFHSAAESPGGIPVRGNDDRQGIGGSHFIIQPHVTQMTRSRPTVWRGGLDARSSGGFEMTGRTDHEPQQSPENGDYEQMPD